MLKAPAQRPVDLSTQQQRTQKIQQVWRGFYETWKPVAATVIQAHWRGYWTRRTLHARRYGRLVRACNPRLRKDTAARVVQRHVRGFLARREAAERRQAVLTIQRWWRGYAARKAFPRLRREYRERQEREAAGAMQHPGSTARRPSQPHTHASTGALMRTGSTLQAAPRVTTRVGTVHDEAAAVIQSCFRGWKARKRYKWLKQQDAKARAYRAKQQAAAAGVIQAHYRGHQARSRAAAMRASAAAAAAAAAAQAALHLPGSISPPPALPSPPPPPCPPLQLPGSPSGSCSPLLQSPNTLAPLSPPPASTSRTLPNSVKPGSPLVSPNSLGPVCLAPGRPRARLKHQQQPPSPKPMVQPPSRGGEPRPPRSSGSGVQAVPVSPRSRPPQRQASQLAEAPAPAPAPATGPRGPLVRSSSERVQPTRLPASPPGPASQPQLARRSSTTATTSAAAATRTGPAAPVGAPGAHAHTSGRPLRPSSHMPTSGPTPLSHSLNHERSTPLIRTGSFKPAPLSGGSPRSSGSAGQAAGAAGGGTGGLVPLRMDWGHGGGNALSCRASWNGGGSWEGSGEGWEVLQPASSPTSTGRREEVDRSIPAFNVIHAQVMSVNRGKKLH
mmetsp:Transcript_39859/g.88607  ORF Transcript_39859/g.88607 Transcript_39859/m.88607 type:complete len:614 (-) Transcript_39859:1986-3827(-)